jgi:hypothetical protein
MAKQNKNSEQELPDIPFREDDLPAFETQEESRDGSTFINLTEPGESFTGMFIRKVAADGAEGLDYPGLLFAEYPSGDLKVMPPNWSIANEIEKQDDRDRKWKETIVRVVLDQVKKTGEGRKEKTVKLYAFQYMTLTPGQAEKFRAAIRWSEQFTA